MGKIWAMLTNTGNWSAHFFPPTLITKGNIVGQMERIIVRHDFQIKHRLQIWTVINWYIGCYVDNRASRCYVSFISFFIFFDRSRLFHTILATMPIEREGICYKKSLKPSQDLYKTSLKWLDPPHFKV